jgi:hypothetical protein
MAVINHKCIFSGTERAVQPFQTIKFGWFARSFDSLKASATTLGIIYGLPVELVGWRDRKPEVSLSGMEKCV